MLQRGERVGGRRLGHYDDQGIGMWHAVAVTIFAGDLDRAGNARQGFDPLLGNQARVIARSTCDDQNGIHARQYFRCTRPEQRRLDFSDRLERIRHRTRLFEDLLLHEVTIRAQFDGGAASGHFDDGTVGTLPLRVEDRVGLAPDVGHVTFLEIRHARVTDTSAAASEARK